MQPIISPWFIYLLGIVDSIIEFLSVLAVFAGIVFIISLIGHILCKYADEFDEDYIPLWKKIRKIALPILIIFALLSLFVPNRNTLIGMFVAKNITHDDVEKVLKTGDDFKEEIKKDIFELIEAIQDKQEKENK